MAKKKIMYNKKEVVYSISIDNEQEEAWVNIILKDGKRVELRGKAATKMIKKL